MKLKVRKKWVRQCDTPCRVENCKTYTPAPGEVVVWCMRPGVFGNPFKKGRDGTRREVCDKFDRWFYSSKGERIQKLVKEIIGSGDVLLCCCKPKQCHCDTIAAYVNAGYNPVHQPMLFQ